MTKSELAGGENRFKLMKRALPDFNFSEQHEAFIRAAPGRVLDLVPKVDPAADPIIRHAMLLREMPARMIGSLNNSAATRGKPVLKLTDFVNLGRLGDREVAFGLAGRFWRIDYGLARISSIDAFLSWHEDGAAKVVIGFAANRVPNGVRLVTRTEIACLDRKALREFRIYWFLIRMVSGLIRQRWLGRVKAAAERSALELA